MKIKNTAEHFGLITKLFHWVIAITIMGLIWLGWYMVGLDYFDRWYNEFLAWHKSLGMLVLGAALLKFLWQAYSPVPDTTSTLRHWEKPGARLMHKLLLSMMILMPLTGYLVSTSDGNAVDIFGWINFPALIQRNTDLRDLAIELHFYLSYGTAVLIIGHVLAALKHQFIDKDSTLTKMLWR